MILLSTKRLGRITLTAFLSTITAALLLYWQEGLMLHNAANNFDNNSNTPPPSGGVWKIVDQPAVPYLGNLTCPYEIAHYNVDSHVNFIGSREKSRSCAKLRYYPNDQYEWYPDPTIIFKNLPHNATIYIVGDSISLQLGIDFLCYVSSISENIKSEIVRKQRRVPTAWCSNMNECDVNYNGHSEIYWAHETFRSTPNENDTRKDIHVSVVGEQRGQKYLSEYLHSAKRGDIIVMNQGLHYMHGEYELLLEEYTKLKSSLLKARDNGVHLLWRETSAAHFKNTTDGYYIKGKNSNQQQYCVSSTYLDSELSRNRSHGLLVPYMSSLGIPILEFWEASFLAPDYCHVGQGIDCLHFLQPSGVTSYFTEILLKYIEEKIPEPAFHQHSLKSRRLSAEDPDAPIISKARYIIVFLIGIIIVVITSLWRKKSSSSTKRKLVVATMFVAIGILRLRNDLHKDLTTSSSSTTQNEVPNTHAASTSSIRYGNPPTRRGAGLLTTHSGCRIAQWLYTHEAGTRRLFRECLGSKRQQLQNARQLVANDTIFVPFTAIKQFTQEVLDDISVDVVIISGQTHHVAAVSNDIISKLVNHLHVMHWFCQNLPIYGGSNPSHIKVSPFPYGIKEKEQHEWDSFDSYKRVLFESISTNTTITTKTNMIFAGPLGGTNPERSNIPQMKNETLQPEELFRMMAQSRYVLSPDGDRPECYRHYEAIGLGTVPITQLDSYLFRHLNEAPIVYNNTNWDLNKLESTLEREPIVKRYLIREDYWMDWCDREVGRKLNFNNDFDNNVITEEQQMLLDHLE